VRHKVLDLYGDLALLGLPIEGHVQAEKGGHTLHQALVAEVLRDREAWRIHGGGPEAEAAFELRRGTAPA
jgi:UDP-3-O-[3-hydroxymyristoyl] N-acetylglucosamine deacetylase